MEKSEKIKLALSILLLVLVVGGISYFSWQDIKIFNKEKAENLNSQKDKDISGDPKNDNTNKEGAPFVTIISDKLKGVAPDLAKLIVVTASLSEEEKKFYTDKIKEISEVLKKDNTLISHWMDLGTYKKNIGDYKGAEEIWKFVSLNRPQYEVVYMNLGDLYRFYLKDYPQAEKNLMKGLEIKADYIPAYLSLHDLYRFSYLQKSDQADDILKRGIEKNPKSLDLHVRLAQYYAETKMNSEALVYYDKAIEIAKAAGNTALAGTLEKEKGSVK